MKNLVLFILLWPQLVHAFPGDSLYIDNLVFEGAGIRGIAYCGALMELEDRGYLTCIDRVAGTSSGAITACLVSIGYSAQETYRIIGSTDFSKFNDGRFGLAGGLSRIHNRLGYYRGEAFVHWLEKLIEAKTGNRDMRFRDLVDARLADSGCRYKDLVIAATSLNHQRTILFSYETFPDMRIVDAVHASMAIPIYFEPVIVCPDGHVCELDEMKESDHLCVDGGFTANFLIQYFDESEAGGKRIPARTLGLRLDSDAQISKDMDDRQLAYQSIGSASDFLGAFFYMIKETLNRQTLTDEDWQRTISISDCGMSPKVKKLSKSEKEMLIEAGRKGVRDYLITK